MDILIAQNNFNVDISDYNNMSNQCILAFFWTEGKCSVSENTWHGEIEKNIGGGGKAHNLLSQTLNISSAF